MCWSPAHVPQDILESVVSGEARAAPLNNLVRQARYLKRQLLFESGVCNPEEEALSLVEHGDQASDDQIDCYGALVVWSVGLTESSKIKCVPAALALEILKDARLEPRAGKDLKEPLSEPSTVQKART